MKKGNGRLIKFKRISLTPPKPPEEDKPKNMFWVKEMGEHVTMGHQSEAHAYRLTPRQAVALGLLLILTAKQVGTPTPPTKGI